MATVQDMSEKMFVFSKQTATDHVKMTPTKDEFKALTVGFRSFTDLKRNHALFSLATPTFYNGILLYMNHDKRFSASVQNNDVYFDETNYVLNEWNSICVTWDSQTGCVQLWINGRPLTFKYATDKPLTGKPIIVLGQDQDNYGGGFDFHESFVGMMTDVHMWDYVLSPTQILRFMKDQSFTPGNILNWSALESEVTGVQTEEKPMTYMFD